MKFPGRLGLMAISVGLSTVVSKVALADNIAVFNTGQSSGGTALSAGTADSHYTLIAAPSGVPTGSGAAVATSPNSVWTSNTSTYSWISPGSSGNTSWPVGSYDYQTSFTIGANQIVSSAMLSGLWTSDNEAQIYLNGVYTGNSTGYATFGSLQSFSITSGFVAGTNHLDFIVTNGGGPTGVIAQVIAQVSGTVSAASAATPEPSSLVMLGTGLAGVLTRVRWRLRSKVRA